MSTQIKYKGRAVVAFESGTAILHTNGEKLEGDLEIMSTGGGGDDSKFKAMVDGSITEVTAEDLQGVTKLRAYAFAAAKLYDGITLPDSITAISDQAFQYSSLPYIDIGNAVTKIGSSAFRGCASLAEVSIGSGVIELKDAAFRDCTVLKKITCKAVTPPKLGSNVFLSVPTDCMIYVPEESVTAYKNDTNWSQRKNNIVQIGYVPSAELVTVSIDSNAIGIVDSFQIPKGKTMFEFVDSAYNSDMLYSCADITAPVLYSGQEMYQEAARANKITGAYVVNDATTFYL